MDGDINPDAGKKVVFDGIEHNEGGHYDINTGVFRCPLDGSYFFMMMLHGHFDGEGDRIAYNLVHQENPIGRVFCKNLSDIDIYTMCGNSAVIYCQTGEEVFVQCTHKGSNLLGSSGLRKTTFVGFLLKSD